MKVVVYARVSTEDQTERETIQNQVQVAKSVCPALGLEIVSFYLDDGVSGAVPLEARQAGAQLLADASKGLFRQVVVYRLDRIGRRAMVILAAHETLKSMGVGLRSLTEPFDTSNSFGEFVMGILAMVAGYERDSILSRTTLGRRRKAKEGLWTGGQAPLGYKVGVNKRLEIVEEEASLVRQIFRWYVEDRLSAQAIATRLNAVGELTQAARRGFTSKRIKTPNHWDHTRVLSILRNETYMGRRQVGKRGAGEIVAQEVSPIVSPETWEAAQRLREKNWAYAPRNAKRDYLLRGLISCQACGRRYVGYTTNSGTAAYYKCNRHECESPKLRAELVEGLIWEEIRRFLEAPGEVLTKLQTQLGSITPEGIEQEMADLERALARIEEERHRVIYLLRKGLIEETEGEAQLLATAQERDQLLAQRQSLEASLREKDGHRHRLSTAEELLRELQRRADEADARTRRVVIESLVDQITVSRTEDGYPRLRAVYVFERPNRIADITSLRGVGRLRLAQDFRLVTLQEYARFADVSYGSAWDRVRAGVVPGVRGGNRWYVRLEETHFS